MPLSKRIRYLLDTNMVSFAVNADWNKPESYPHWVSRRIRANVTYCYLPVIATQELLYGINHKPVKAQRIAKTNQWIKKLKQLDFDPEAAKIAAQVKADLARQGTIIEDADIQIAAIALRDGLILVTDNVRHFGRIPSLKIENWRDTPMSVEEFFQSIISSVLRPLIRIVALIGVIFCLWLTTQVDRPITALDWWLRFGAVVIVMALILGGTLRLCQRGLVILFLILQRKHLI